VVATSSAGQLSFDTDDLSALLYYFPEREFTITSTVSKGSRTSETSSVITVTAVEVPSVEITPLNSVKVNPSKKLRIKGYIDAHDSYPILTSWSLTTNQFALNETASAAISSVVQPAAAGGGGPIVKMLPLVLPPNSLQGGVSYTFKLSGGYESGGGATGYSEITLVVNTPPTVGSVVVDNGEGGADGVSLVTSFSLFAINFVDDVDDYPLRYSFQYV